MHSVLELCKIAILQECGSNSLLGGCVGINRCADRRRNLQLKNNSTEKEISIIRRILTEFLLCKLEIEVLLTCSILQFQVFLDQPDSPPRPVPLQ